MGSDTGIAAGLGAGFAKLDVVKLISVLQMLKVVTVNNRSVSMTPVQMFLFPSGITM